MNFLGISFAYTIAAAAEGANLNPISFDYTLPSQIVSFLILLYFLKKFAWQPLLNVMEKRRQFIEDNLTNAERERKEAEKIRKEYQEEMRQARAEAQGIIENATKISEHRAEDILTQARLAAEKMNEKALADISRERDKAMADVKNQVVDMSIAVAEKIIRQKLDMTGQEALMNQFIEEVGERPC